MPNQFQSPDDVTPEDVVRAIHGRKFTRDGATYKVSLNIADEAIEEILADAGIDLGDEDDIYGDDE